MVYGGGGAWRAHVINALYGNDRSRTLLSSELSWGHRALLEVLAARHTMEASAPTTEPMREEEEEEEEGEGVEGDRRKGSSSLGDLVPQQVHALQWAMPIQPGIWISGQSIWVARWGLPASSKVQRKVPTIQVVPPPPEMDKRLVW